MKIKKIRGYLSGVICLMLSSVIFLALITFNSTDNSWLYYSTDNQIKNLLGYPGSVISSLLFYFFGYASYVLNIFLFFYSYFLLKKRNFLKNFEQVVFWAPLFLALVVFLQIQSNKIAQASPNATPGMGGLLGFKLNNFLLRYFDSFLVGFFCVAIIVISILVITRCSFVSVSKFFVKTLEYVFVALKKLQPIFLFISNIFFNVFNLVKKFFSWVVLLINHKIFEKGDPEYFYKEDDFWQNYFQSEEKAIAGEPKIDKVVSSNECNMELSKKNNCVSYKLPNLEIFTAIQDGPENKKIYEDLEQRARILEDKLEKFGVYGKVKTIEYGPVVTLFEYSPNVDTKISKIIALEDDLALALEAMSIRIIAPIPGKPFVGFEVANKSPRTVYFSNIVHSKDFKNFVGELPLILGKDSIGRNVIVDLYKMPHLLVAGSTGSGKSVALNSMLASLLCKHSPDQLKLILIDPKRLEFSAYQDIAHLLFPIVTHPKKSVEVLKWLVQTMEERYAIMAEMGVKNINDYHFMMDSEKKEMPFIVLVIDELADLMMTTGKDIEVLIARIAQMARAAGIHMIVATQRPSVDVITGLIKVNFPSRISFRVVSKIDSRTILDGVGAEKLLGRGDMLFLNSNASSLERIHGAYLSTKEINDLVHHIKAEREPDYVELNITGGALNIHDMDDNIFTEILDFLKEVDEVSISFLQRKFRIGYNRSARIMEQLEEMGYILPADGSKMRKVVKDSLYK